jgi:hypothetical protein
MATAYHAAVAGASVVTAEPTLEAASETSALAAE